MNNSQNRRRLLLILDILSCNIRILSFCTAFTFVSEFGLYLSFFNKQLTLLQVPKIKNKSFPQNKERKPYRITSLSVRLLPPYVLKRRVDLK